MVAEFNAPPESPLLKSLVKFVPPVDQSPKVAVRPPQVINKDPTAVTTGNDGETDKDNEVMEVDNLAGILSSD